MEQIATYKPTPGVLRAKTMFDNLQSAGRSGDFQACSATMDAALEAGLRASEILVGVLHPALVRIGQLWESGEITVAEEHRFTDSALRLMDRLPFPQSPQPPPLVILANYPDNSHEIGLRMLQILTWERGIPCERLPAGTSAEAIAKIIASRRPDLVGLSVSLLASIPASLVLAQDLSRLLPPGAELVLGGQAFRRDDTPGLSTDHRVLPTVDAYLACLQDLQQRYGHRVNADGGRSP